uniref:AAA family ATPase n=1 Tax=Segatella hominis TaxID=2518605 RepID=UPI00403866A9
MDELLDLGILKTSLSELIAHSNIDDCVLPNEFKAKFNAFGDYKIEHYNLYTLQVSSKKSLLVIPNQWVYIAACCCQYYVELIKYKDKLDALGFTSDMYEACHPSKDNSSIPEDQKTKDACKEKAEQFLESYDGADKELLVNFLWNYESWGGGKNIKRSNDFTDSPVLNIANTINASSSLIGSIAKGLANQDCLNLLLESTEWKSFSVPQKRFDLSDKKTLQQIFYGAPGTGKSHAINELTTGKDVIRTTFHPDTDYSTFVGAYKPTTKSVPVTTVIGTEAVPVKGKDGKEMKEDKIVYEFVSQAFMQAYVEAWKKYCTVQEGEEPVDEYLVIEEINRGNCAQIFGDLFQLLDRGDEGFSEYPIKADSDMKKQLKKEFAGLEIKDKVSINDLFKGKDIVAQVLEGEVLLLPNNLYIWATMNTSDQSLFPIDSAFKRRWDWYYVPISNAEKNWTIEVNGAKYDWWNFLQAINDRVYDATYSEDKKLGYFFCKADDGIISSSKFVSKVIFYLWNDVFKDSEFEGSAFRDENGEKLSFDKFYSVDNGKVKVNEEKVELFLKNLELEPVSENDEDNSEDGFETEGDKTLPRSPKVFAVTFPDGTVINEANKFETYHKVLSKIGIEKVENIAAEMKYHRHHTPLVTKSKHEAILNDSTYNYIQEGNYYVVKGINQITMYRMVMLLNDRLNLQLNVQYE